MFSRWIGDKIGFYAVVVAAFLLPLFTLPLIPSDTAKIFILVLVVCAALVGWSLSIFTRGIRIPKHFPLLASGILIAVLTLSALTSPARLVSFVGSGFELNSLSTTLLLLGLLFFTSTFVRSWQRMVQVYFAFILATIILIGLALIGIAVPNAVGTVIPSSGTLAGNWNMLGILSGITIIFILITLELRSLSSKHNIVLYLILVLTAFGMFLGATQFTWIVVALLALAISMFSVMVYHRNKAEGIFYLDRAVTPYASIIIICLTAILLIAQYKPPFAIHTELPTWRSTFSVAGKTLSQNPMLGEGLNRFTRAWQQYRPENMVLSQSWKTDFSIGVGYLPSYIITAGMLGVIGWLYFLYAFIMRGFKHLIAKSRDNTSSYFIFSSFLASCYLWIHLIYGEAGAVIAIFAFLFTGLFFAALSLDDRGREVMVLIAPTSPFMKSVTWVVASIFFLVAGVSLYFGSVWFAGAEDAAAATKAMSDGDLVKTEQYAERALQKHITDNTARLVGTLRLTKLQTVLARGGQLTDAATAEIQLFLSQALTNAQQARDYDPTNYQNPLLLAQINESVDKVGVAGAYKNAQDAYLKAIDLNPTNPELDLARARLEIAHGSFADAQTYVESAIKKKNNYADAWFLQSQLQANQKQLPSALTSIKKAVSYDPGNFAMMFQLGLVEYQMQDYQSAADVLSQLVVAVPSHANARYFLGLSYYNLNQTKDALDQFAIIRATNPDNTEVKRIIDNIKAGRKPF